MRTSGAMTHRLSLLERAALVRRVSDLHDGRRLLVELTAEGVRLVDQVAPLHLANERELLTALSPEEQRTLGRLLRKMLLVFEREHPTPPASGRGGRRKSPNSPTMTPADRR